MTSTIRTPTTIPAPYLASDIKLSLEDVHPEEKRETRSEPRRTTTPSTPQRGLLYHLHTLYLFTVDDFPAIVIPSTVFGLCIALAGPPLTTAAAPSILSTLGRTPLIILWTWLHLLVFTVSNQRHPAAVLEDRLNKPYRPIAAGRLTPDAARRLLLAAGPLLYLLSHGLGTAPEGLTLFALTWANNDLGAGDGHWLARHAMNALGFTAFGAGAAAIAAGPDASSRTPAAAAWRALLGAAVLTTVQAQDLRDVKGDRVRGRATLPLVAGDAATRWSVALPALGWSAAALAFWRAGAVGCAVVGAAAVLLAWRVLRTRGTQADRTTWKVWCLWMGVLYTLPLIR